MYKVYVVSQIIRHEGTFIEKIFPTKELAEEYISLCQELKTTSSCCLDYEEIEIEQDNNEIHKMKQQREEYKEFKGFDVTLSRKGIISCEEYNINDQYSFELCLNKTFYNFHNKKSVLCLARNKKEAKAIALEVYRENK